MINSKISLFPVSLTCAALLLSACQAGTGSAPHMAEGDTIKRAEVTMVRLKHTIKAEDDQTDSASAHTISAMQEFLLDSAAGYADTLLLDAGDGVSGNRINDIAGRLRAVGLKVGKAGIYGTKPRDGNITLYIERYRAEVPPCKNWAQSSLNSHRRNSMTPNFGCSNNAALAAMVANPRDLVAGQTSDKGNAVIAVKAIQALSKSK